jgi:ribosomal protein S12 methylthiotransferase accessory factor YcaO
MRTREVIQNVQPIGDDRIVPGWRAEITPSSVTVTVPEGHWARVAGLPALADGRTRIDADIDGMAECLARYLKSVVNAQKETA